MSRPISAFCVDVQANPFSRVALRPVDTSDTHAILTIWSDPEVMRFYDMAPFTALPEAEALIASMMRERADATGIRWVIVLNTTKEVIGTCGFRLDHRYRSATLGFELARDHWRQGLMREALQQCIAHAYECWDINRIQGTTDLENIGSIGLMKSLGFQEEGILRQWGYWKSSFHDVRLFSLLRQDHQSTVIPT